MQLPKYRHNYLVTRCKNANILDAYVPIFKTKILPSCSISFSSSIHQEDSPLVFCTSEDLHIMSIILTNKQKDNLTFAAHQSPVASTLSTFPEPATSLSYKYCFADATVLWSVDLLARAEATIQS
jgi:hypothetical protein